MSIFLYRMRIQWHKWLVYLIRRVQRFVLSFRFFFQTWAQASLTQKHFYWEYKASHESGVENLTFIDLFSSSFHQIEKYISLKEWIIPGCPEHIIESWSHAGTGTQYENSIKLLQISGKKNRTKTFSLWFTFSGDNDENRLWLTHSLTPSFTFVSLSPVT